MELAVVNERQEIFKMLTEVTEITDKVKLIQMSVLMKSDKPKRSKNEFQSLLETVPVDLVRKVFWKHPRYFSSPGEQHKGWKRSNSVQWDTFAKCHLCGKN